MGNFSSFDISSSGIYAQRIRMDTIANNIANAESTKTPEGGPYKRQSVSFKAVYNDTINKQVQPAGVMVEKVVRESEDFRMVYDPGHPDADKDGYVKMPNVNIVEEMVDMVSATRAYEANVTAMNSVKNMISAAIELGKS